MSLKRYSLLLSYFSFRSFFSFLSLFSFFILLSFYAHADFPTLPPTTLPPITLDIPKPPPIEAKSHLLIDFLSDHIISSENADVRVEPASLTKMMTVYVADMALKNQKIKFDDKVKIGEKAWRASGSRMFLELNSETTVAELLKGIIIQSGNDASIALAEHIAGDEAIFVQLMNHFAKQLGMTNTHFENATGLPSPNHYTTARDMSILAKALIADFPETYSLYSQKEFIYKNIKQQNRNRLLWQHAWVDGIKTGHTDSAGYCLVASGKQEGMRLIAVIMGAKTDAIRTEETNKMLSYGFRFFETRKLFAKESLLKKGRIWMGKENEIAIGPAEDIYITLGKGSSDRVQADIKLDKVIKAPIEKGAVLGTLTLQWKDNTFIRKPLIALQSIPEANIFSRSYDALVLKIKSYWDKDKNEEKKEEK